MKTSGSEALSSLQKPAWCRRAVGSAGCSLPAPESQPARRIFIHFGLTIFSISEQLQFS